MIPCGKVKQNIETTEKVGAALLRRLFAAGNRLGVLRGAARA